MKGWVGVSGVWGIASGPSPDCPFVPLCQELYWDHFSRSIHSLCCGLCLSIAKPACCLGGCGPTLCHESQIPGGWPSLLPFLWAVQYAEG